MMENRGIDHSIAITKKHYANIGVLDAKAINDILEKIFNCNSDADCKRLIELKNQ